MIISIRVWPQPCRCVCSTDSEVTKRWNQNTKYGKIHVETESGSHVLHYSIIGLVRVGGLGRIGRDLLLIRDRDYTRSNLVNTIADIDMYK